MFDLEQITALSSAVRSEVFFAFSRDEPKSTSDVAREIGKAPQAVRHHVLDLVRVNLIVGVSTRKVRSRTETLYVTKSRRWMADSATRQTQDYIRQMCRGFTAILRAMDKERAAAMALRHATPQPPIAGLFRMGLTRMTEEQAWEAAEEMSKVHEKYGGAPSEAGLRYRLVAYIQPVIGETMEIYKEVTGKDLDADEPNAD